ncbi:FAD-dependent oxidoreductase [Clostridium aestuarii]|uniref:FAD-dependent oxidoreductase n=1 Tax=Clostridium aestuarii TaxID=338193 RepID=A0ABT4CXX6_9CLOT|nr:FAD-dependent oxidoreductase [Clostridium aestuarii]MCY6483217.1 FAD-dependent oxidoreductase [Clostridium aestuarii]
MILSSTNTYWNSINKAYKLYPTLNSNQKCDVIVIGGGITGCLITYYLSQYNLNTILIEKNLIAHGNTAADSSILKYDMELQKLINYIGKKKAVRIYKLCQKSIDDIENILYNIKKVCDFEKKNCIYLSNHPEKDDFIEKEFKLRKELGFDVQFMNKNQMESYFPFCCYSGILSNNYGIIDPFKFCHALLKSSTKKGVKIYENTTAISYDYSSNIMRVNTDKGHHIHCKKIVFADSFLCYNLINESNLIKLKNTYSIITNPISSTESWYKKCIILESDYPHMHITSTKDNRILASGFDDDFNSNNSSIDNLGKKAASIKKVLENMYPHINNIKIDYLGNRIFTQTEDNIPIIGEHPKFPNCYFNLGFDKNSTIYSVISGQIIKDLILYNNNPDAEIFSFNR